MHHFKMICAASCLIATIAGCAARTDEHPAYDPGALPHGSLGASIAYGHAIVVDTRHEMPGFARARMSCEACHLDAGTKSRGGSFIGTYARFPQWNERSKRVIALQDRLAECFLYSMNGHPPAYDSKAMIALVAYIAWLSRDVPTGSPLPATDRPVEPPQHRTPNLERGGALYAARCEQCHQSNGNGVGEAFPPLWGANSFNSGAGMARLDQMTGFVKYNMPVGKPGSLSLEDAYDVSAFVLHHSRPRFDGSAVVRQTPRAASFF
ncbi:MAG TPA: c-type cytochrome [Candidatus Tumulicola sp.]|jgi:thiosulfate dehydrogenase